MTYAMLDSREWRIVVDLETGAPVGPGTPAAKDRLLNMANRVTEGHPYPGDLALESIEWVTDTALRIWKAYDPGFMFISYAQPQMLSGVVGIDMSKWNHIVDRQFGNVDRFLAETEYVPILVGLGDMTPIKGYIDLTGLDGIGYVRKPDRCYAGLFGPSGSDLLNMSETPGVERVVSRQDIVAHFGASPDFERRCPDYLVVAEEGYTFKAMGSSPRTGCNTVARNRSVPVYTSLHDARIDSIVDIRNVITSNAKRQRIALILMDGIGIRSFRGEFTLCENCVDWYTYSQGDDSYLAISTGRHFQHNSYPPGWLDFIEDRETKRCPYDGYIANLEYNSIGNHLRETLGVSSAAVGSRSTFTHLASGADICVECCCCGLHNYGTKAAVYSQQV